MKIIVKLFVYIFFVTSLFSSIHAEDIASISLFPQNPPPKSNVTVTLESYYFDVNTAKITWKVNKRVILSGVGEKEIIVKTGAVGEGVLVSVSAENNQGVSVEQEIQVTPSSVSIFYEAPKSYVPPFYEGRSLPADGAFVKVTAFPQLSDNGVAVPPSVCSYSWIVNGTLLQNMSGYGKQSATFHIDYLTTKTEVKVIVRSPFGNQTSKEIVVVPHDPMPILYQYDPVFGTDFTKIISSRFETVKDFTISLEPFYLSRKDKPGDAEPRYAWYLDGLPTTPLDERVLAFRLKENTQGLKILDITVVGPNKLLQSAKTSTEIIFDTRK